MKATAILLLFVSCFVVLKADEAHNCTSMRKWYPGIEPKPVTGKTPYKLIVTSSMDYYKKGLYRPDTQHNVTLIKNDTADGNGTFVGFMISVKAQYPEDISSFDNFLEPLPEGVEVTECNNGYKFEVARNSSSKERKSVHLRWKPPNGPAGNITFSASVAEAPGVYYEGFNAVLEYQCPMMKCYLPHGCPNGVTRDKYGCKTCTCAGISSTPIVHHSDSDSGAGSIGVGFSSFLGVVLVLINRLL